MNWRPRGAGGRAGLFRVGAMRERVNIQTSTDAVDTTGQPIRSWATTYANEPAEWTPTGGGEILRGRQIEAGISAVFTIHYRASLVPQMRIVHGTTNYGIVRVRQVEGGRRYVELDCKAVV